jgi:hypothetical protein
MEESVSGGKEGGNGRKKKIWSSWKEMFVLPVLLRKLCNKTDLPTASMASLHISA